MGNANGNKKQMSQLEANRTALEKRIHARMAGQFPDYAFLHRARLAPIVSKTLSATAQLLESGEVDPDLQSDLEVNSIQAIEETPLNVFDELEVATTQAAVEFWADEAAEAAAAAIRACNIWYDAFWPFENPQAIAQASRIGNIANTLPAPTFFADVDGQLTFVSYEVEELLNLPEGALEGKHLNEIFGTELAIGREASTQTERIVRGRNRTFSTTLLPSVTPAGVEYFGFIQDITASVELEKITSGVLNVMSHEMRTPLTTIIGYLELLSSEQLNEDDLAQALEDARGEARHLNSLINDVVEFAKFGGEVAHLVLSTWSVAPVVDHVVEKLFEQNAHVSVNIPETLTAYADRERFSIVLEHLLANAYVHGNTPIIVECESLGDGVELRVIDQGPGLPFEVPATAFEAFVTGHDQVGQGAGLGLTICQSIMNAHGGSLSLSHQQGTRAIAWFPDSDS